MQNPKTFNENAAPLPWGLLCTTHPKKNPLSGGLLFFLLPQMPETVDLRKISQLGLSMSPTPRQEGGGRLCDPRNTTTERRQNCRSPCTPAKPRSYDVWAGRRNEHALLATAVAGKKQHAQAPHSIMTNQQSRHTILRIPKVYMAPRSASAGGKL